MKNTEIAYAAGIFDGEGSIHSAGGGHKYSAIRINITNTNPKILDFIQQRWPGKVIVQRTKNYRDLYRWNLYNKKALKFLLDIQPYCIAKSPSIKLAIEYITLPWGHIEEKKAILSAIKDNNHKPFNFNLITTSNECA